MVSAGLTSKVSAGLRLSTLGSVRMFSCQLLGLVLLALALSGFSFLPISNLIVLSIT